MSYKYDFKEKQTHKEYLEYLKIHDPITYSEMTSDPCGTSSNDGCFSVSPILIIAIAILVLLLTGCSDSELIHVWQEPDKLVSEMTKSELSWTMLVMSIIGSILARGGNTKTKTKSKAKIFWLHCFNCGIDMPVVQDKEVLFCSSCGLKH